MRSCKRHTPVKLQRAVLVPVILLCMAVRRTETPVQSNTTACNLQVYSPTPSSFRCPEEQQDPAVLSEVKSLKGFVLESYLPKFQLTENVQIQSPSSWTWHTLAQTPQLGQLYSAYTNLMSGSWPHLYDLKRKAFWKKTAAMIFFHVFQPGVLKPRAKSQSSLLSGKPRKPLSMWKFLYFFPHCSPNSH